MKRPQPFPFPHLNQFHTTENVTIRLLRPTAWLWQPIRPQPTGRLRQSSVSLPPSPSITSSTMLQPTDRSPTPPSPHPPPPSPSLFPLTPHRQCHNQPTGICSSAPPPRYLTVNAASNLQTCSSSISSNGSCKYVRAQWIAQECLRPGEKICM